LLKVMSHHPKGRDSELDPPFLHQTKQTRQYTRASPADEGLGRPPPQAQFSGHSTPLGAILVALTAALQCH
jgi:hypothetical protein